MNKVKTAASILFVGGLLSLLLPGTALAARHTPPARGAMVVFGTIAPSGYTAAASCKKAGIVTIVGWTNNLKPDVVSKATAAGGDTAVVNCHSRLSDMDSPAPNPVPAPAAGDAAAALLRWNKGVATVKKLEYGSAAFAFWHEQFAGTLTAAPTGTCPSLSISLQDNGKKGAVWAIGTNAATVFEANGAAGTCTAFSGSKAKARANATANEMTDNSLLATLVNTTGH